MKNIWRNRTFLGIVGISLALVICFAVAPALNAAAGKQVEIVRITKNVSKGTRLTADMLQTVKVGGYNLPDTVLKSSDAAVGKYALASLQPGDYILSSKVSATAPDVGLSSLDGKQQAVSVSIKSFAAGLSGKLETGDVIELYVAGYGDMKETISPPELQYVQLLAATTDKGMDNTQDNAQKSDKSEEDMPSTLTVLVSPAQAARLVDYENNGTLHAALVYRGSETGTKRFLALEDEYLNSLAQEKTDTAQKDTQGGTGNDNSK